MLYIRQITHELNIDDASCSEDAGDWSRGLGNMSNDEDGLGRGESSVLVDDLVIFEIDLIMFWNILAIANVLANPSFYHMATEKLIRLIDIWIIVRW